MNSVLFLAILLTILLAAAGFLYGAWREAMYHVVTHNLLLEELKQVSYFYREHCFGHGFHHTAVDGGLDLPLEGDGGQKDLSRMSKAGMRRRMLFYAVPSVFWSCMLGLIVWAVGFPNALGLTSLSIGATWFGQIIWLHLYEEAHFASHFGEPGWANPARSEHHLIHHREHGGRYGFWWWIPNPPVWLAVGHARLMRKIEDAIASRISGGQIWLENMATKPQLGWYAKFGDSFPDGPPWMAKE